MIASEGRSVQLACRVLGVSESGYYDWRGRAPSPRAIRQAWLTDLIREIHIESFQVYGAPRVHAELTLGRGITVGHNTVGLLMRRNGIKGLPSRRRPRPKHDTPTAVDLVGRDFARTAPNTLWVTDIERHEALLNRVEVGDLHRRVVAAAR